MRTLSCRCWTPFLALPLLFLPGIASAAESAKTIEIQGVVFDSAKQPVAGAVATAKTHFQSSTVVTNEKGQFHFKLTPAEFDSVTIQAKDVKKRQLASQSVDHSKHPIAPLKLELKPARTVQIQVNDAKAKPISGASVAVHSSGIFSAVTNDKGLAECFVPMDSTPEEFVAWKAGLGLDYRSFLSRRGEIAGKPKWPTTPVTLTLTGAKKVQVRLVDTEDKPLVGTTVYLWLLRKPGESTELNLSYFTCDVGSLKTDSKGIVTINWIPTWQSTPLTFWHTSKNHVRNRINYDPAATEILTAKFERLVSISGKVVMPDGKPAAKINVLASGAGYGFDSFRGQAVTDEKGRYEINAAPNQVYMMGIENSKWGASPKSGFAVLPNKPITNLDFKLQPTTKISGRLTQGKNNTPLAGKSLFLRQVGTPLTSLKDVKLPNPEGSRRWVQPSMSKHAATDKDGKYVFYVGPGEYTLHGPHQIEPKKFVITNEKTINHDLHALRAEKETLIGKVVTGTPPKPVAGALVQGIYRHPRAGLDVETKTDAKGQFKVERKPYRTVVHAKTADGRLAGVTEITADDTEVTLVLKPTGSAKGILVDHEGNLLKNREISYGVRVPVGEAENSPWRTAFGKRIKTDAEGRFVMEPLLVGSLFHIDVPTDKHSSRTVGTVQPKDIKVIDLGKLTLAAPYRAPTLQERIARALASKQTPKERFAAAIRDARLSKQHVMVIFVDADKPAGKEFFRLRYEDRTVRRALDPYQVIPVSMNAKGRPAATELAKYLKLSLEKIPNPLVVIYDTEETRLANSENSNLLKDGALQREALVKYLGDHAPKILDAKKVLADALAQAKKENKRVIVQETATWCPPCWLLSRYLDRHRDIWSKDYIWIKMDHRWIDAIDIMKEIRNGANGGIPWYAILDADGKKLVTSNDAKGNNIGFPDSQPSMEHFMSMLEKTKIRLTKEDLEKLRKGLEKRE